jgi:hypothetical protein
MSDQEVAAMEAALTTLMTHLDHLQQDPSNIPLVEETVVWARKCAMDEQVESGLEMLVRLKGCRQGASKATRTELSLTSLQRYGLKFWEILRRRFPGGRLKMKSVFKRS